MIKENVTVYKSDKLSPGFNIVKNTDGVYTINMPAGITYDALKSLYTLIDEVIIDNSGSAKTRGLDLSKIDAIPLEATPLVAMNKPSLWEE